MQDQNELPDVLEWRLFHCHWLDGGQRAFGGRLLCRRRLLDDDYLGRLLFEHYNGRRGEECGTYWRRRCQLQQALAERKLLLRDRVNNGADSKIVIDGGQVRIVKTQTRNRIQELAKVCLQPHKFFGACRIERRTELYCLRRSCRSALWNHNTASHGGYGQSHDDWGRAHDVPSGNMRGRRG